MSSASLLENASAYQEVLRRFKVYSLQGWQELPDLYVCGPLLLALSKACRGFLRLERAPDSGVSERLESVEWDNEYLTLWGRFLSRSPVSGEVPLLISEGLHFKFAGAAVSRFTTVLFAAQSPDLSIYSYPEATVTKVRPGVKQQVLEVQTPDFMYRRILDIKISAGPAAIIWHEAFALSAEHIEQLFRHFAQAL